jgi:hypothetical protein
MPAVHDFIQAVTSSPPPPFLLQGNDADHTSWRYDSAGSCGDQQENADHNKDDLDDIVSFLLRIESSEALSSVQRQGGSPSPTGATSRYSSGPEELKPQGSPHDIPKNCQAFLLLTRFSHLLIPFLGLRRRTFM